MERNNYGSDRDLSENDTAAFYSAYYETENQVQQSSNCEAIYDNTFQQTSANIYSELGNE